jgi:hypothetical protein
MKKKIMIFIGIIIVLVLGFNLKNRIAINKIKKKVMFDYVIAYPQEEFKIIYGPTYNMSFGSTNIRYRVLMSSKRLEDLGYYNGYQVNLESVDSPIDTRNYKWKLDYLDIYTPLKREAKKIFGNNIIFEIDGTYTSGLRKVVLYNLGTDLPIKEKTGFSKIIFTAFVDDLDKEMESIYVWKEKMYKLGKRYWEYYNILGALQLYIYDRKTLKNYEIVNNSLGLVTIKDSKIKDILNKIKNEEDISKEEEIYLLDRMITGKLLYNNTLIAVFFETNEIEKKENLIKEKIEAMRLENKGVEVNDN